MTARTAAVVGATGYVGSELVRWLLGHPELELVRAASTSHAGELLSDHVPSLLGATKLRLTSVDPAALAACDVVFLATPHGAAQPLAEALAGAPLVIDASSDHRADPAWVYGPPELVRETLRGARRIAAPGCFATAVELSVGPLAAAGAVAGPVYVAAATGSTGSGATPVAGTHHPERFANLKAYAVGTHRHIAEIERLLASVAGSPVHVVLVPASAPVDRGIFATCFVPLRSGADAGAILRDAYANAPLIRFREGSPELRHVRGTAFADLSVHAPARDGDPAIVLAAIDNLGKGAAAQAVQCANLALGLPESAGLVHPACTP